MSRDDADRCLALLREAEGMLLRERECVLASHLSLVSSRLRERVMTERVGRPLG